MNNRIYQGYIAKKRFGQHFLHDSSVINAIVTAINPKPNQAIVEIGPGLGALTKSVAKRTGSMIAIEFDRNLATRLAAQPFLKSRLKIIQEDAMRLDFDKLSAEQGQTLRIFGNLPYNISTPLMFHLFSYAHVIHDMHFMLQQEVVTRLLAHPNSKNYSRLSVMAQYYSQITPVLSVPPNSFRPVPKVNSVVIKILPYQKPPFLVFDLKKLAILTSMAFKQRRKTLRNSLGDLFSTQQLSEQGVDSGLRAENVTLESYCRLANVLSKRSALQN